MFPYTVVAFYKFVKLTNLAALQVQLKDFCEERKIVGTILLAPEGINGTIAGEESAIEAIVEALKSDENFSDLTCKYSYAKEQPFKKLKILLKKEIVALGRPDLNPAEKTGVHVPPESWNALINDPQVLVIDTRNDFEVNLGSFKNAQDPKTRTFKDFTKFVQDNLNDDKKKQKKVAMFCTGGIRCEKASALLLEEGFTEVYQLEGGILKYLEKIPEEQSLWQGECFIFDERVTIDKELIRSPH